MELSDIFTLQNFLKCIDILAIALAIYFLLKVIRGTRAMQLVRGLLFVIIIRLISWLLNLETVSWVLDQVINWGPIALIVIFQQEIRRSLENIGRRSLLDGFDRNKQTIEQKLVVELSDAADYLSKNKIGALIVVEQKDTLQDYVHTGIELNADVSSALLINTFIPNTPLHDGAVIIRNFKIAAAAAYLPLSDNRTISKELGTRHRSAVGLSEQTDAIIIVVSEETGDVSIAQNGYLNRKLDPTEYRKLLSEQLIRDKNDRNFILKSIEPIKKNIRQRTNKNKKGE